MDSVVDTLRKNFDAVAIAVCVAVFLSGHAVPRRASGPEFAFHAGIYERSTQPCEGLSTLWQNLTSALLQ